MTEQALRIPLAQIEEHPDFQLRLEYEHIDELAQSFIQTAKADWAVGDPDSNGQLEPGRAKLSKDEKKWDLYSGLRRYRGMQRAYELTRDKRFSYYWLYDDTGISREEMLRRALEDRPGIRENLTPLEEVRVARLFKDVDLRKVAAKSQQERFERLQRMAQALDDRTLKNLHEIEGQVGHAFELLGLEFLSSIPTEPERLKTAAVMGSNRYDRSKAKADDAQKFMDEALGLPWFRELFPAVVNAPQAAAGTDDEQFRKLADEVLGSESSPGTGQEQPAGTGQPSPGKGTGPEPQPGSGPAAPSLSQASTSEAEKRPAPSKPPPGAEENVLTAACPYCDGPVLVKVKASQLDIYRYSIASRTATLMAAERKAGEYPDSCEMCGKPIYIYLKEEKKRVSKDSKEERVWKVGVTKRMTEIAKAASKSPSGVFILWDDDQHRWDVVDSAGIVVRRFDLSAKSRTNKKGERKRNGHPGR